MFFLFLIFSCIKSINFKSKVFPLEILQNFEEDENYNYLKELGLLDTLNNMSKILLSEPVTFSKYERSILQSILNRDISSFTAIYEGKGFSNEEELTLLHYAALVGAEDIFEYLVIQKKEDIKQRDYYGRTCLHFAFLSKNFNLCRKIFSLLEQEDKEELLKAKDRNGASCFHYLAFSNLFKRYKEEKEIEQNTLINFMKFSEEGSLKLSIGSNFKDNQGLTPLHYAAYFCDLELCKEFLDGIDEENIQSEEIEGLGRITPLGIAYISKELEIVKYLAESNLKICEEDLKLKEFFELDRDKKKEIFSEPKVRHIDIEAIDNGSTIVDQENEEITENSSLEVISGYFSEKEHDLGPKLQKGKESILHELIRKGGRDGVFSLLDKLKEIVEKDRDEFLKHKDENGDEALYLAIDKENIEIVDKMLELYSEKARNERLCFEYYEETILDRAIKNRNAKMIMSLVELKKKYRPKELKKTESNKVKTELIIKDILEEIKRIVEEQDEAESFDSEEILLNEEEQKESIILKLIEENIEKKQNKEELKNKENKFKRLIKEKGKEILILASYVRDKEVIGRYLEERKVNTKDKEGRTILLLASMQGHKEVVELLLKKGAVIDLANKDGWTPLYVASQSGHKEVVELLLSKGAAIDLGNKNGWTPLYAASKIGQKEVVELLLTKGAAIDLGNKNGCMPLYVASHSGHKEVVELLLTKGAAIDLANKDGWTPLSIASQNGYREVVELLITKGAAIDLANKDGGTPLYVASHSGHKEVVELLITKGATIDLVDKYRGTPLIMASQQGHREIVELLLTKGAAIDLANKYGFTPLYIASQKGHREVVELLLTKGAAIDLANDIGETPLSIASLAGRKEVVELLLTNGASIDLAAKDGRTPLFRASNQGHKEVVELLITKGAAIDLANDIGETPLYIANATGKKEIVELLLSKRAKIIGFKSDFPHKKADFVKDIIAYTIQKNNTFSLFSGEFLLKEKDIALYVKLANCLPFPFMLENFFDISSHNYYGYSSLHLAVMQDSTDSLKKLLSDRDIFAFVNSYDNKEKESCLALAVKLDKLGHVKVLLSFLASPIYFKYSLLNKKQVNVLDIPEIKEYASNKMIFDVLQDGRSDNAGELLFGHVKAASSLELKINNFSYKDIINLKAIDSEGKNVFHYLAIHAHDELDLSHFFSRVALLPSFSGELLFAYDKFGMTPFHYALFNSNEQFVKYFLTIEDLQKEDSNIKQKDFLKKKDLIRDTKNGEGISDLIKEKSLSKGIINLIAKHVWSVNETNVYDFISNKHKQMDDKCSLIQAKIDELNIFNDKDDNVIYSTLKCDDKDLLIFVLDKINKDKRIAEEESLLNISGLAINLNAFNCLKEIFFRVKDKEKIDNFVNSEMLFKVCEENKTEVLAVLAEFSEEKLAVKDMEGNTLLHAACLNRKEEVVRELLKYEIVRKNINAKNDQGNTAMHNVHISLSPNLIDRLKEAGLDVNIKNKRGKRAIDLLKDLTTTSQQEGIKIGTIYCALCALLNREYDADYTLTLHLAVQAKEDWVIKDLSARGLINSVDEYENTALHLAIKGDRKDIVKALLERGANFFVRNKLNESPLDLINSKDVLITVLDEALKKDMMAEYLLNIQNKEGNTLLHLVIERVKLKKLEVEIETKTGEIITEEVEAKDKEFIKALLDNAANKNRINLRTKTPIDIASSKNKELEKLLITYLPNLSPMRFKEGRHFQDKEEDIKKKGRDEQEEKEVVAVLNDKREHDQDLCTKRRAIHVVVERDDEYALGILLQKGSSPEWQDVDGKNSYKIAIDKGSIEAFRLLVNKGSIESICKEGNHGSAIYLVFEKDIQFIGGKFFNSIFDKLKEEYEKGNFKTEKLREMEKDPISKIIERDDKEMLEKVMEIGLRIIDEEENNLLVEAMMKNKKKVFSYLVNNVNDKEVFSRNCKGKTVIEEAQIKSLKDNDSYYARCIQERIKKLKGELR